MVDELVDKVNPKDEIIGREMKSFCHSQGFWHRVSANLIFNNEKKLWLQTRKAEKIGGGLLDYSASGHVAQGQSYEDAAYRELEEELGIRTELKKLGKVFEIFDYPEGPFIRHVIQIYTGFYDGPFEIQEDELESVDLYDLNEVKYILLNSPHRMTEGLRVGLNKYFEVRN